MPEQSEQLLGLQGNVLLDFFFSLDTWIRGNGRANSSQAPPLSLKVEATPTRHRPPARRH